MLYWWKARYIWSTKLGILTHFNYLSFSSLSLIFFQKLDYWVEHSNDNCESNNHLSDTVFAHEETFNNFPWLFSQLVFTACFHNSYWLSKSFWLRLLYSWRGLQISTSRLLSKAFNQNFLRCSLVQFHKKILKREMLVSDKHSVWLTTNLTLSNI